MRTAVGIAFLTALIAGPALGADMAVKAPIPMAAPWSWTGTYVGLHAGFGISDDSFSLPDDPTNRASNCALVNICGVGLGDHWSPGAIAGGQFGINYQFGWWVIGAEAEGSWANLVGSHIPTGVPFLAAINSTVHSKINGIYDAAIRYGYAFDHLMIFGKAGVAWAHDSFYEANQVSTLVFSASETRIGWLLGTGAEYALTNNWSAKIEYDYVGLGSRTIAFSSPGNPAADYNIRQSINEIKAGINYRFRAF